MAHHTAERPHLAWIVPATVLLAVGLRVHGADSFRAIVERDWLLQERCRAATSEMKTAYDAAGACDGVKDGKWAFHTAVEDQPWWQVDLGRICEIGSVAVWNRCDATAGRNARLRILLSDDGSAWRQVYQHDGTTFYGHSDGKPLVVDLGRAPARYVRIQLPDKQYLHLDEVEVFGADEPGGNLALGRPAEQSSLSQWSTDSRRQATVDFRVRIPQILEHSRELIRQRREEGVDVQALAAELGKIEANLAGGQRGEDLYMQLRWLQRRLTLADPLLSADSILFVKRAPGVYSHMSDQYYGWWSRPGGGIYLLSDYTGDGPQVRCLTESFTEPGSFLRPMVSYDGKRVLFSWCKHHPGLHAESDKLNKANVPEDAFYHVYEMDIDGSNVRQLTFGKYDDFDARYLPDGRILFLSTRRGHALQAGRESAMQTLETPDLPDCYVRCGGGPQRPVAVYTMHTMNADGGDLCAVSPFEMFEWTPSVAADGTILYSRWDYIDRDNMPFMSLWAMNPDGTNARIVYSNYTRSPHCTFEPRSIPGSQKIIFTASGHHAQTMGSLVLLDPTVGTEGSEPITRLTPEVAFPEIEGWPSAFYANPWPLSERMHLVCWGAESNVREGTTRVTNGMGLYLFDAEGNMELLYRDPEITCATPIPVQPRREPPVLVSQVDPDGGQEGRFLLADVYRGLKTVQRGEIKALRVVAVPPKTHPTMNYPNLGLTRDDPGKCVLGTVPVEEDGSAYFRVPAGVIVFFQALDAGGMAVQTMRSTTHVQPGQTLSCVGCHESRQESPTPRPVLAMRREPSKITVGPEGSWPLRFDRLVYPVIVDKCVGCHRSDGPLPAARGFNLADVDTAYQTLTQYGEPSLYDHVMDRYRRGVSVEGGCVAASSRLLARIAGSEPHYNVKLGDVEMHRLIVWMDTYAQRLGSFGEPQEKHLMELRRKWADLLIEPQRDARTGRETPIANSSLEWKGH